MKLNLKEIEEYIAYADMQSSTLNEYKELFDLDKLYEFERITQGLKTQLETAKCENRTLSIGFVGAMKAGKSSFLNALIFDGREVLPKAATPMTAALTKITYSKEPKAKVYFYSKQDWNDICAKGQEYDNLLQKEYDKYLNQIENNSANNKVKFVNKIQKKPTSVKTIQEFEKTLFRQSIKSEFLISAKELVVMAEKNPEVEEKLEGVDEINGDVTRKLQEYVGANGKYTPIVNYVELQIDNEELQGLEIIDTPGLNDPIVSRGDATKRFLTHCDAILLLSPCSQFMDNNTMTLMENTLPEAGVSEILVVGSKFDSGILNDSSNNFLEAYKRSKNSYIKQYKNNINNTADIKKIKLQGLEEPFFISSMASNLATKIGVTNLDEEEQLILDNFKNQFGSTFKEDMLKSLSGMSEIRRELYSIKGRKEEIITNKSNDLLKNSKNQHLRTLENILHELGTSTIKLHSTNIEELKYNIEEITKVISTARKKILFEFDKASNEFKKNIEFMTPDLKLEQCNHYDLKVTVESSDKTEQQKTGFLGMNRSYSTYTVVNNKVSTSEVIKNIKECSDKCHKRILEDFDNFFNKEAFTRGLKNILLEAFSQSDLDFNEEDILMPISLLIDDITIAKIDVDAAPYIDTIRTKFRNGHASNDRIHELYLLQMEIFNIFGNNLERQLRDIYSTTNETLKKKAVSFADDIENEFCKESEKLQTQVTEKEIYLEKYKLFTEKVKELKRNITNFEGK